eukprot:gene13552-biopygen8034
MGEFAPQWHGTIRCPSTVASRRCAWRTWTDHETVMNLKPVGGTWTLHKGDS